MLKNSNGIKFFSVLCYLIGLTALGFFIYEMVTLKGEYEKNLGLIIGLGVGAVMFLLIALVLNPPKMFNRKTFNFVCGLVLFAFAGVSLAFMIYSCVTNFELKNCLICGAVFIVGVLFGMYFLQIAKQEINIDARDKKQEKLEEAKKQEERANLTKCPYCGCRIKPEDDTCPNCKSKL